MSIGSKEIDRVHEAEYYALLLTCTLGMFFMASSSNLLMAYLSLEMVSLGSYVLTGFLPHSRRSSEAALKYLIYGGVASGTMIYGMSWIFGMTGSLDYAAIQLALSQEGLQQSRAVHGVYFHLGRLWLQDRFLSVPHVVAGCLSGRADAVHGVPLGGVQRRRHGDHDPLLFPGVSKLLPSGDWAFTAGVEWPQVLLALSMLTMTVGNLCALNQRNVKRMLAYSGIAHAGYMMMGLAILNNEGLAAILFYAVVYLIMNVGAFLVVGMIANVTGDEDIDDYRGLAWRGATVPAICLTIFLFSLTGLPPFAGFIGKFFLFSAVVKQGGAFAVLAIVAALNSVVSLYYYAKIVKIMFLDSPLPEDKQMSLARNDFALLLPLTGLTILLGVYFAPLVQYTNLSLQFYIK